MSFKAWKFGVVQRGRNRFGLSLILPRLIKGEIMINHCDLCDEEKEVRIAPDRIRICEDCEEKYPYDE